MAYQDWFDGYQRGEVALRGYFRSPEELTAESVQGMDRSAADLQRRAQALIDNLAEYRQSLAARYAALMVMPYEWRLDLIRERRCDNKVWYHLKLYKLYEDGTKQTELQESYPGTERHKAIARYKELCKERPGITATMDIARKAWER